MQYDFDATNKKLGRLATEVADTLRGKNSPHFAPNVVPDVKVVVANVDQLDLSEPKLQEKYARYSGYPGGLRFRTREQEIEKKGYGEMFRRTVRGMLPDNRLRDRILKNLVIVE